MKKVLLRLLPAAAAALLLAGCTTGDPSTGSGAVDGGRAPAQRACVILPDVESSPRWEHGDRPALGAALKKAGFAADIRNAEDSETRYAAIAGQQMRLGCGVMLLVELRGAGAKVLAKARAQGIPVIAYDRPIPGADYAVSFDNVRVGELQGQTVVDGLKAAGKDPEKASVVFLGGDPTDGNAAQLRQGAARVMAAAGIEPAREPKGTWDAKVARKRFARAFAALDGDVDAVWAANDANAASAIAVLQDHDRTVPVSGQDASVTGLRNVLLGRQTATVYKPFQAEAKTAGELAVRLLMGDKPKAPAVNGGVPFFAERPILTDAQGIRRVLDDGNATVAAVCRGDVRDACDEAGIR